MSYATIDALHYSNIIPFADNVVQPGIDGDNNEKTNMLFMINKTIIFKDSKGITQEFTYLGTDGILKHRIRTLNDTKFLVDGILFSSLDSPGIETIPVTVEQYAVVLPKFTHFQIEPISNPQSLNDDQRELMGVH